MEENRTFEYQRKFEANKPGIIATKCLPHQCIEKEH